MSGSGIHGITSSEHPDAGMLYTATAHVGHGVSLHTAYGLHGVQPHALQLVEMRSTRYPGSWDPGWNETSRGS